MALVFVADMLLAAFLLEQSNLKRLRPVYFHLYLYKNQIYVVANNKLNIYITVKLIYRGMAWKWDQNTHNYNKYNISQSNKRDRQGCSCRDKSEQRWYNQFQAEWSFTNSYKHNILAIVTQFSKRRIFCFGCGWSTDNSKARYNLDGSLER